MSRIHQQQSGPLASPIGRPVDDWEDWEDEDVITPIDPEEQVLVDAPAPLAIPGRSTRSSHLKPSRPPSTKLQRLRSSHRQKAQNAKAGIKLITDMTAFRRQNHIASQLRTPDGRPVKFVDAAALRALEGEPSSASVGNWNWLKKDRGKSPSSATPQSSARSPDLGLTPGDGPITIGITLPSEETTDQDGSRNSATTTWLQVPTPTSHTNLGVPEHSSSESTFTSRVPPEPHVSVWSPDTPETASSQTFRPASSVYSQATNITGFKHPASEDVPPVPALPSNYKKMPHQRLISLEIGGNNGDSDDGGTPCTLFEEDGSPGTHRLARAKSMGISPESAGSRSNGWWDHIVTPFLDKRFTVSSPKVKHESPKASPQDQQRPSPAVEEVNEKRPSPLLLPVPGPSPPPIVRAPTPRRTPSPPLSQTARMPDLVVLQSTPSVHTARTMEKPHIIVTPEIPMETPPPYSPPKLPKNFEHPIRYRAVFPPGHPLQAQFPPSPGPGSPGLAATMTSQGATQMTDIPITPTVPRDMPAPPPAPLPDRLAGTYRPQEHSHDARGSEHRVERERRRHEKEEVLARKAGGFWRGRGCIPATGCFGRRGREGRKRRRVWIGVLGALLALIILAVVLGVVLTRPADSPEVQSIWVNLTDYPPMPTGVLTVVGTDNTVAKSGCTRPSTLWSCSLPKDDHESVAPYEPNQPKFIMQIQWDNSTSEGWKVPNGEPPKSVARRASGGPAHATSIIRELQTDKFKPDPSPPDFEEMWFLGDTTDGIESDEKAGEPAPFYISLLSSTGNETADSELTKRQTTVGNGLVKDLISSPDLLRDGTPAPAVMIPQPAQQPVRLYDRGLPTEHYGFYTYFKRTIYVKSVDDTGDEGDVPLDKQGGCKKTEANYLVTWAETRMLVQIWTRTLGPNGSKLLDRGGSGSTDGSGELIRPGTMPYPVTVALDTHGGDPEKKYVWMWPMNERQELDEENPKLLGNDLEFGGKVANHRKNNDTSFGGFDGGTGGCRCEWVNWV